MGCCGVNEDPIPSVKYGVSSGTPCSAITVDLLTVYKNMITCYLTYKLWAGINSTEEELQNAAVYLQGFISQKQENPDNCSGVENLWIVRQICDKIVMKGVCL